MGSVGHEYKANEVRRSAEDYGSVQFIETWLFVFQYLRVAWLTYPYHCCAFQFPATHHPEEFAKHEVSILTTKEGIRNSLRVSTAPKKQLND
jgi:hypothetical protein